MSDDTIQKGRGPLSSFHVQYGGHLTQTYVLSSIYERSTTMIEIEDVLELFIAADEKTKILVEQILRESRQTPGRQDQHSEKAPKTSYS